MHNFTLTTFYLFFSLIVNCGILACAHTEKIAWPGQIAALQGYTDQQSAQFTVVAEKNWPLAITYRKENAKQAMSVAHLRTETRKFSPYVVYKFSTPQLQLGTHYLLEIHANGKLKDQRKFRPLDLNKKNPKIIVASCMSDHETFKKVRNKIWSEVMAHQPDLLFLIGDNVYADSKHSEASPTDLWNRYIETRLQIPLFQQRQLVPILATWDDHDFGKNNGGQEYKHKEESKKIFETFFAQEPAQKLNKGPGVASHFTAFDHNFVFMDNRFFRTENNKDFKNQSHWGTDQEQWLMKIINHNKTPTWIINGDQVWATYHQFESYAVNHPKNFAVVAKKMGGAKSPLFFISGDRHLAEILEVKPPRFAYKTYELTTSGLHANLYPRDEPLPAGVIDRNNNQYNYALLIPQNRSSELKVKVKVYGLGSQLLFKRNLIIKN